MIRRASRRSFRAGGDERWLAQFRPTFLSGCVLWLRSDLGITLNDTVVAFPNAFDNAAWTKNQTSIVADSTTDPFGGSLADSLVEDNTNNVHNVAQTPSGFVANLPMTVSVYAKASTRTWLFLAGDGFTKGVYFNLSAGTIGSTVGTVPTKTIASVGNGWYLCTIGITPAVGSIFVATATADGVNSYLGDGASKIFIYGAAASQPKVSAWADQSGLGHHVSQGTAANQPLFVASGLNGRPTVRFDGAGDTLKAAPFTLNQPLTLGIVYKSIALGISAVNDHITDGNTLDSCGLLSDTTTQTYFYAGAAGDLVNPAVANGAFAYVDALINGNPSTLRANGVQVASGNAGTNNAAGFALGAGGDGTRSSNIEAAEVIIYNRILSAAELARLDAYRKARYAL